MKQLLFLFVMATVTCSLAAQNIGIGLSNSRFPLGFNTALGQKISFRDTGAISGNNFGIGIQAGLLQIHTSDATEDIAFGFGKSNGFTERFRFKGNGNMGVGVTNPQAALETKGRIRVRNTFIFLPAGIWFGDAINQYATYAGMRNDSTFSLLSNPLGSQGFSLMMNTRTGNVGIKQANPLAPLSFPPSLGKKLSLTGNTGFSVSGNRLEVATENNFITFFGNNVTDYSPYKFTIDNNGGLYVNYYNRYPPYEYADRRYGYGNAGSALISNGPNAAPAWGNLPKRNIVIQKTTSQMTVPSNNTTYYVPPGFKPFKDGRQVNVRVDFAIEVESVACFACGPSIVGVVFPTDHNYNIMAFSYIIPNGQKRTITGSRIYNNNYGVPAGVNLIQIQNTGAAEIKVGSADPNTNPSYMMYEVL